VLYGSSERGGPSRIVETPRPGTSFRERDDHEAVRIRADPLDARVLDGPGARRGLRAGRDRPRCPIYALKMQRVHARGARDLSAPASALGVGVGIRYSDPAQEVVVGVGSAHDADSDASLGDGE